MYRTVEIISKLNKINHPKWVDLIELQSFLGNKSLSESKKFASSLFKTSDLFPPQNNFVRVFIVTHYGNGRRAIKEVKG